MFLSWTSHFYPQLESSQQTRTCKSVVLKDCGHAWHEGKISQFNTCHGKLLMEGTKENSQFSLREKTQRKGNTNIWLKSCCRGKENNIWAGEALKKIFFSCNACYSHIISNTNRPSLISLSEFNWRLLKSMWIHSIIIQKTHMGTVDLTTLEG